MIKLVSVVVPIYNEEETIVTLHRELVKVLKQTGFPYELIFVDDGSTDRSLEIMRSLKPVRVLSHAANRGQVAALDTGIAHAKGDVTVFIDADLQNDPKEIPLLLRKIDEGYGAVIGLRQGRNERWTRMLFSRLANAGAAWLLNLPLKDFGCGLKAYRSVHIRDFRHFGETQVFLPAVAHMRGAKVVHVPVTFNQRAAGFSKVRISFMLKGSLDLLSLAFFVKYSMKPFRFFGAVGVLLACLGSLLGVGVWYTGSISDVVTVGSLFFIASIIAFMFGLALEMLMRVYYGSGARPLHPLKEEFAHEA